MVDTRVPRAPIVVSPRAPVEYVQRKRTSAFHAPSFTTKETWDGGATVYRRVGCMDSETERTRTTAEDAMDIGLVPCRKCFGKRGVPERFRTKCGGFGFGEMCDWTFRENVLSIIDSNRQIAEDLRSAFKRKEEGKGVTEEERRRFANLSYSEKMEVIHREVDVNRRAACYERPAAAAAAAAAAEKRPSDASDSLHARKRPAFGMAAEYTILGVDRDCSWDVIRANYLKRVKEVHPDKQGGSGEQFDALHKAYKAVATSRGIAL